MMCRFLLRFYLVVVSPTPGGAVTAAFSLVGTPVCAPAMALLDIVGMSEAYAELAGLQSTVCF